MLQFITGRSGTGKTAFLKEKLCTLLTEEKKDKLLFLVPEQLSFETEKDMLYRLGAKECRKIEVLSFSRLADFVYRQTGMQRGKAVDDGGRAVLMSLAIEQAQDQLALYKKQAGKPELIPLMLNAVKEFKMCAISTDRLREAANSFDDLTLRQKLHETALIADIYDALLQESYVDPLDELTRLYERLRRQTLFTGYTVAVDGFSGFTVQEQKILEVIIKQSALCMVSICGDAAEFSAENNLFFTTKRTKHLLKELAEKTGTALCKEICLAKPLRYTSAAIAYLEETIDRPASLPYTEQPQGITVYSASDIYEECDFVARTIRSLTIEEAYTYHDIAVICRNRDSYSGILDTTFQKYGIAYFMDQPQQIAAKPLMLFVLSAFDSIHTSFATDSVLRFIKTGLTGLSIEEAAALENYVFIWNISGKRWLSPFTANPQGYSDVFTVQNRLELDAIEDLRQKVISPLLRFREAVKDANGIQISKAVYKLLQAYAVSAVLKESTRAFTERGSLNLAQEQERLWDIFMGVLDCMALILGERPISSRRYRDLLKLVINSADISFIPNSLDEVTVGTADRVRLDSPKAVFVIGAIEGEFPHMPVPSGVFTDQERKRLLALRLPLYDSIEALAAQEKFLSYSAVSAPSQKLYISYYRQGLQGENKMPSSIVRDTLRLFPALVPHTAQDTYWTDRLWAEQAAFEQCARYSREDINAQILLDTYFAHSDDFAQKCIAVRQFAEHKPPQLFDSLVARTLFGGDKIKLSASQVEKYYLCPFAYFCRYGLNAQERKPAQIDSAEYGSLIHFLMEAILKDIPLKVLLSFTQTQLQDLLEEKLQEYLETHFGGAGDKTQRYISMLARMKNAAFALVTHILQELSQSAFTPVDFELFIGEGGTVAPYELSLNARQKVLVQGYVDRIDVMHAQNKAYIRVVDYKTGSKKFVLSDVLFGLNLQMLIYLSAITKSGPKKYGGQPVPAGVLYMPSAAAVVNAEKDDTPEAIAEKRAKAYRMNGLLLEDIDVIKGMEQSGRGIYIPVTLKEEKAKKAGKADAAPSVIQIDKGREYTVSKEGMHDLFEKIDELVLQMAHALCGGHIAPVPAKGTYDACKWCPYTAVCGYKDGMPCRNIAEQKTARQAQTLHNKGGE